MIPEGIIPFVVRGTAQSADERPPLSPALDQLLDQHNSQSLEVQLLLAAGTAALQSKTGFQPLRIDRGMLASADGETSPYVTARSQAFLPRLLTTEFPEVLHEWLALADSQNRIVTPEVVPALISHGSKHPEFRLGILKVIGNRGLWLAQHMAGKRKEWLTLEPERQWGKIRGKFEKGGLLQFQRQIDPDRGRALLEAVWEKEDNDSRFHYLRLFQKDLTESDIPFLTELFSTGSKDSRMQAANMLAYFESSDLVTRIAPQVEPFVTIQRRLLGQRLALDLDGLTQLIETLPKLHYHRKGKARGESILDQALELSDLISFVPVDRWLNRFGIDLPTLWGLAAKADQQSRPLLQIGIAEAVVRSRQRQYALDLLSTTDLATIGPVVSELYQLLTPSDLEKIILESLDATPKLTKQHPAYSTIMRHTTCYTQKLSRRIITAWKNGFATVPEQYDHAFNIHLAHTIDPSERFFMIDTLAAIPAEKKEYRWHKSIEHADVLLQIRDGIRRSFLETDSA